MYYPTHGRRAVVASLASHNSHPCRRMALVPTKSRERLVALALLSLAAGAALRLSWPADMEFKGDEQYVFARTQLDNWPSLGMPSSVGVPNPAMSVWAFVLLARAFGVTTPTGLGLAVMGMNVGALALLFAFAMRIVDESERERWLWALALVAVSPLAVLRERKIWAPSIFPALAVIFWAAFWRRDRRAGAFVWGLVGVLLGQIHMSGFFFAAGVVVWEAIRGRTGREAPSPAEAQTDGAASARSSEARERTDGAASARSSEARERTDGADSPPPRRTRWSAWLAGSLLGALPMVPWLGYVLHHPSSSSAWDWRELVTPRLWLYGLGDSLGLGLNYNLGVAGFVDFLRYPRIGGVSTYLVGSSQALIALAGCAFVAGALVRAWRTGRRGRSAVAIHGADATSNALRATFLGYGALVAMSGLLVQRHYLVVTYPLEWVLLAALALGVEKHGRRLLAVLWAAQLVVTTSLLAYLHAHGGAAGDYGVAYRLQSPASPSDAAASSQVAPSK